MRTSSRFDRAFADFAGAVTAVVGLSLGFAPSGCVADPGDGVVTGEAQQDLTLRAQVSLDQPFEDQIQTGSVCTGTGKRCFAHAHATAEGFVQAAATPQGFGPADLQAAYKIPTTISGTPIVAIVDAFGYPQLESDLAAYRTQ